MHAHVHDEADVALANAADRCCGLADAADVAHADMLQMLPLHADAADVALN